MISSKADYEDFVVKLLNTIITGQSLTPDLFPGYSEKDYLEVLYQCVSDELVIGFSMGRSSDGNPYGQRVGNPYVTIKGLSYIDSVSQAKALEIAKNAESKSIKALLKANKSYLISVAAFIATLLINADRIVHNVRRILSYLAQLR